MTTDDTITRNARYHLSELIEQLLTAHEHFKQASPDEVADAFARRWLILGELEEFLRDAIVELSPREVHEDFLQSTRD